MGPAAAALRSPRRAVPSKREGERKLNCMPYPKNRRLSPSGVPHAPIHGRTSTALALSVLVCISLLNQPHSGLVPRVSAGYIPAGDRPQHRRQRRGCGVSASVRKTSAPNADQSRSRQGGVFTLLSRTRTPPTSQRAQSSLRSSQTVDALCFWLSCRAGGPETGCAKLGNSRKR